MANCGSLLGRLGKSQACWTRHWAGPIESCLSSILIKLCTLNGPRRLVGLYVADP
jgi:hypothetical protein